MDIVIQDDMVKESRLWKPPTILFFVVAALFPLVLIGDDIKTIEFIFGEAFFILIGCYFLYGYLYARQYKVVVTNEKIVLKTLFKNTEVQLQDIKYYNCKRYKKSELYQFFISCPEKKILISTRYKDGLEKSIKKKRR